MTATLSVAAFQRSVTAVWEAAWVPTPCGVDGAVWSGQGDVVAWSVPRVETLPAASNDSMPAR